MHSAALSHPPVTPTYHAAIGALHAGLGNLGNSLEGPISGTEEENGGPVVGKIFCELATRTGRQGWEIMVRVGHGNVERVLCQISALLRYSGCRCQQPYASDDLVEMRRWVLSRRNQGIQALDGQAGAPEPKESMRRGDQPRGGCDGVPLHLVTLDANY